MFLYYLLLLIFVSTDLFIFADKNVETDINTHTQTKRKLADVFVIQKQIVNKADAPYGMYQQQPKKSTIMSTVIVFSSTVLFFSIFQFFLLSYCVILEIHNSSWSSFRCHCLLIFFYYSLLSSQMTCGKLIWIIHLFIFIKYILSSSNNASVINLMSVIMITTSLN